MTAPELAELMKVHPNKIRRLIASEPFKEVEKGVFDTGRPYGGKFITVFKLVEKRKSHTETALSLAKKHTGLWGQLLWSNSQQVDRVER
jgi:hypothetical protein